VPYCRDIYHDMFFHMWIDLRLQQYNLLNYLNYIYMYIYAHVNDDDDDDDDNGDNDGWYLLWWW